MAAKILPTAYLYILKKSRRHILVHSVHGLYLSVTRIIYDDVHIRAWPIDDPPTLFCSMLIVCEHPSDCLFHSKKIKERYPSLLRTRLIFERYNDNLGGLSQWGVVNR